MSYGRDFVLTLLTDDPAVAARAAAAGINRIGPDLERVGKLERQGGMGTRISEHDIGRIPALRDVLPAGALFTRINPIHDGSKDEIERLVGAAVDVLMLPYFKTPGEVERFVSLVGRRARTVALVETAAAAERIRQIVAVDGLDEVHFGLNDLRMSWGLDSPFEAWLAPAFEAIVRVVQDAGKPCAIAGIARPTERVLPVPAELVYPLLPLFGATGAIVARSFGVEDLTVAELTAAVSRLRTELDRLSGLSREDLWRAAEPLRSVFARG